MDRQEAIDKLNDVFDCLDKIELRSGKPGELRRILLVDVDDEAAISGCILVHRTEEDQHRSFITWGLSPYNPGIHSGHYDMNIEQAETDWAHRVVRGW